MSSWDHADKVEVDKRTRSASSAGRCIAALCVLMIATEPRLFAQQESPTTYITASGGFTLEQGAYQIASRGGHIGLGGHAVSGGVGAGDHLSRRVKAAVEVSVGGPISEVSRAPGNAQSMSIFDRTVRSTMLSGIVGLRIASHPAWIVAGVGLLHSSGSELYTSISSTVIPNSPRVGPIKTDYDWSGPAGIFGADLQIAQRARLAAVLSVRGYLADRGANGRRLGMGPLIVRPTIGIAMGL